MPVSPWSRASSPYTRVPSALSNMYWISTLRIRFLVYLHCRNNTRGGSITIHTYLSHLDYRSPTTGCPPIHCGGSGNVLGIYAHLLSLLSFFNYLRNKARLFETFVCLFVFLLMGVVTTKNIPPGNVFAVFPVFGIFVSAYSKLFF